MINIPSNKICSQVIGGAVNRVGNQVQLRGGDCYIAYEETPEAARPAICYSRTFNPAQTNYLVHEDTTGLNRRVINRRSLEFPISSNGCTWQKRATGA